MWNMRVRMANRLMSGIYGLVMDKIEKIGIINPNEHDEGSIVNYLQNDINKFWGAVWAVNLTIESFYNIVACIILGIKFFGNKFFVLVGGIAVMSLFTGWIFKLWFHYEDKWASATDKRLQAIKNLLNNIRFIKLNAMENIYLKKVSEIRGFETSFILKCCLAASLFRLFLPLGNAISIVTFLYSYFKSGGILDVSTSTILLRIFGYLNNSMIGLPAAITGLGDMFIGSKRLTAFL